MAEKKVRFAVVGVGGLGIGHIQGILNNKNAELVYVCDNVEDIAKRVSEKYNVPYYTDFYENLMKDEIPSIMEMVADQKAKYGVE